VHVEKAFDLPRTDDIFRMLEIILPYETMINKKGATTNTSTIK
jgi:hypothetical protein